MTATGLKQDLNKTTFLFSTHDGNVLKYAHTVVQGFTGDLVLVNDGHQGENVFLEMMGRAIQPLPGYRDPACC